MIKPFTKEEAKEIRAEVDRKKKNIGPPTEPKFYILVNNCLVLQNGEVVTDLVVRDKSDVGFVMNFIIDEDASTLIIKFNNEDSFFELKKIMDLHARNLEQKHES